MKRFLVRAMAVAVVLGASQARAVSPELSLSQLGHTAWRVQDGALPGVPTAIAQTIDGYIWIGTPDGLVRFDGAAFTPVAPPRAQGEGTPTITALNTTQDGSLWIGTPLRLLRWRGGRFHTYESPLGYYSDLRQGPDGKIWVTRSHTREALGSLCEVREDRIICYGPNQGIPFKNAGALAVEKSGAIWIGSSDKLARWQGGHSQVFAPTGLSRNSQLAGFEAVAIAPDGSIWSGVLNGGPGLGLQHFADGRWTPVIRGDIDTSNWRVTSLLFDHDGTLWVGTTNRGIYRLRGAVIDQFGASDGLSADFINDIREDREGNVWAVTTSGVDKFRATPVVTVSTRQGLSSDDARAVLASASGAIWVSNDRALDRIEDGRVISYGMNNGFPGYGPTALFEDSHRRLWVGADDGVAVFEHERFSLVGGSSSGPIGPVFEFAAGPDSTVWAAPAGLPSRLIRMSSAQVVESILAPPGTNFGTFASAPDGTLWVTETSQASSCDLWRYTKGQWVTYSLHNPPNTGGCGPVLVRDSNTVFVAEPGGIATWRYGKIRKLTPEDGLPCATTRALVFDRRGNLWLNLQCGVAEITSGQLSNWVAGAVKKLNIPLLDVSDGALPGRTNFYPAGSLGPDGKVWFANGVDLQYIDPEHEPRNSVVPPVQIQALRGDGHLYGVASPVTLPALTRDVQIDFTALSFVVPGSGFNFSTVLKAGMSSGSTPPSGARPFTPT